MAAGEITETGDGLPGYRAIDSQVPVGHIPLDQCLELQTAGAIQELEPSAQLDYAWVGLEASMAMTREANPQTGQPFKPKEINTAISRVQADFRTIVRNEELTPGLRAAAGVALASAGLHHEMTKNERMRVGYKSNLFFLRGLQAAARILLPESNRTPDDDRLLHTMTSLILLTEYGHRKAWYLPAPPRQPWDFYAKHRRGDKLARIAIADAVSDGLTRIPPEIFTDEYWGEGAHGALAAYTKQSVDQIKPGKNSTPQRLAFDRIAASHFAALNFKEEVEPSLGVADALKATGLAPADSGPAEVHTGRPEIVWYLKQPAGDFRQSLDPAMLRIHLLNMEEAQARGELDPAQQHILGWMHFEQARITLDQAQEKRREAERARTQEGRVSRADAPGYAAAAAEADMAAGQLMTAVKERFDTIRNIFLAAAEALPPDRVGESFQMLFDAEGIPVYKALLTEAGPSAIAEAVDHYVQQLMASYVPMRAAERKLGRNANQLDALQIAAVNTALCLLVTDSSDEAARDLALPASPRSFGNHGPLDAVVFPIDWETDEYNTEMPVTIQVIPGKDVTHKGRHVDVGLDLLIYKPNILGLLGRLAAATRANRTGANKKRARNGAIDTIAYRITNAIADAIE